MAIFFPTVTVYPAINFYTIHQFALHAVIAAYIIARYSSGEFRADYMGIWGVTLKLIPLIAVILAALTIIFIFVIYPEIAGDPEGTATEPAAASQETESDTEAAEAATASQTPSENEQDTAAETESVTAASPVSAGYHTGHYVNCTESRVHIRNTTSKSGKHLDYVQPEEYIDVFEVLDLGASTDATVRWWGKVTKGDKTGWVSLYYLTCVDLMGTPLNADQIDQLWQALQGYWNTLDKKRYSSFQPFLSSPCRNLE